MPRRVLIANRGEIALRIARAAADMGLQSVAVHSADDAQLAHLGTAGEAVALAGSGPAAYLDIGQLVAAARATGCDAVHPGYGFLSERVDFAQACADAGLVFIGPTVEQLALLGDKARARALALQCGVPLLPGSAQAVSLDEARAFFAAQGGAGVMVKALGGGGGRGMRAVLHEHDLGEAYARCVSEARSFGVEGVYVERLMARARHVEVQVLGDGERVMSLGERECSLQRRFQKLVEVAPCPGLPPPLRERLVHAALAMADALRYRSLGTFEFLVDQHSAELPFAFIEANARLQVEHTVTEEVTGLDLVQLQIGVAAGRSLAELGLDPDHPPPPRGHAIQWRINAETLDAQGQARPSTGTPTRFELPAGPGVRVDTHGRAGTAISPHYDTLLAKLIVHAHGPSFADALRRSNRALAECAIEGVATNLPLLRALAARSELGGHAVHTRFVEDHLPALLAAAREYEHGETPAGAPLDEPAPHLRAVRAPMTGRLVHMAVAVGDVVPAGAQLAVMEAMKMEHELLAHNAARVLELHALPGDTLAEGEPLLLLEPLDDEAAAAVAPAKGAAPGIRGDLQRVIERHAHTLDAARPEAVAKRHALGLRTARENIADLCDAGSFSEYGALAVAAQRSRRSADDLMRNTPADGIVTGIGSINGEHFDAQRSRAVVMAYDATVLAGTQGLRNHQKTDRLLGVALQNRLPVVLFAEGGGGRPGDTDMPIVAGLHVTTFASFARLSGQVPVIGIAAGRCFAGNAALLGCCDVIIATRDANIGMGGPAMIEGGGLGVFKADAIGPAPVQSANGVIDVLVEDEAQAVAAARHYLSFFQGPLRQWECADQKDLRDAVPENRLRVYDVQRVLHGLVDTGSLLELRSGFGPGMVTALARIEGRPVGMLANNPGHLGGAIDADAADKAARFMQLCNAHALPIVSLVDTPGFMVGPETEKTAQVRHVSRLFVTAGALRVPCFSVVLRKGYGLGAMGMTAGGFHSPDFIVAWPTGEFGAMGLEGAVRLGYRKELEAAAPGEQREALYRELVARQYESGGALNMATTLEIDAVIDPAETRSWIARGLASARVREGGGRFIDTW
ncbi:carboxyl transferase domain-containing protein [Piscinibacter sp. XHJ-5]|uniref:acetyl-CoA carboxylase family protein n=1 Tax=Piscinibacter sp. XHJ-5 TaxID=3037797 RepID=UPI002452BD39|nr:carboxyl transferase domain-containing protein [Piscinibacter sp. XHJ-5]